jgi:hypothetical protein
MAVIETEEVAACAGWAISENTKASAISKLALLSAKNFMALRKRQQLAWLTWYQCYLVCQNY